jgi:hypothetical protein
MLNKEELKRSLKLYKDSLGPERYKVKSPPQPLSISS